MTQCGSCLETGGRDCSKIDNALATSCREGSCLVRESHSLPHSIPDSQILTSTLIVQTLACKVPLRQKMGRNVSMNSSRSSLHHHSFSPSFVFHLFRRFLESHSCSFSAVLNVLCSLIAFCFLLLLDVYLTLSDVVASYHLSLSCIS